ncbi:hypothetical protein CPB97_011784 [Podila verticillata]|nr:hypothetical protein CPB97_011784 [Podila verticillata]
MGKLNLIFATAVSLAISAISADASFSVCVGARKIEGNRPPYPGQTTYGYYLWNDRGDNSADYHTFPRDYDGKTYWLGGQNGWKVSVDVYSGKTLKVKVANAGYGLNSPVNVDTVCAYKHGTPNESHIAFGCYSTDPDWCRNNREWQTRMCGEHIEMGKGSVSCTRGPE